MTRKCIKLAVLSPLVLLFLPVLTTPLQAQPELAAETAVEEFLNEAGDWGFAAAVWADGKVAWSNQWGPRDKDQELAVTADTLFRIGSVSKMITAMTLASMAERGELSLDTTIDSYLPQLPDAYKKITPRMLAGHLAGIRHYDPRRMQQEYLSQTNYDDQSAALSVFIDDPLKSQPGESYFYSTYGYTTLGAVMESASKQSLINLMRDRVFNPAGMTNSFGEHNEPVDGEMAIPYAVMSGRELIVPSINNSGKLAGGGLVSTPTDLARFLGAVAENRLVSASTLEGMLRSQETDSGEATGVGLGWRIADDAEGRRYIHHGGSAAGGRAFVMLYPQAGVGVAMCMNLSSDQVSFAEELAMKVIEPFLKSAVQKKESD